MKPFSILTTVKCQTIILTFSQYHLTRFQLRYIIYKEEEEEDTCV